MEKERMTTPATKNMNSRSIYSSTHLDMRSKTPTRNEVSHEGNERFNFTIESKKKQSLVDKIQDLVPFLDTLINKTETRSSHIVSRLVDLKSHIDDIFDEINLEFEQANQENAELRDALDRRQGRTGSSGDIELHRKMNSLLDQLDSARRQKQDMQDRLANAEAQTREAYELLDQMKREVQRVKRIPTSDRETHQLRSLRDQLQKFKKKPLGIDESMRRRLDEYEQRLRAQNGRFRDLEGAYNSLARKSNLDQQELNRIKRSVQEADRTVPFDQAARRRIQEMEGGNQKLKRKAEMDQEELNNRLREIRRLEQDNQQARENMREFQRLSDLNQDQLKKLKSQHQRQRRQTVVNEQGLIRKLKSLDDQKTQLLRQAQSNQDRARDYQNVLAGLTSQIERERRATITNDKQRMEKIRALEKHNSDLAGQYNQSKGKLADKQGYVRQLQEGIREKEKKLQDYIQQLTRKTNLNQDQLRMLSQELEREKRKSMADDNTIKTLQRVVDQQKDKAKTQIAMLESALEQERRKSMADEAKIKNMERILNQKLHMINETEDRNVLAKDEIKFLKDEIEEERRKSMADQQKIRKLQNLLGEKEKYLGDVNNRHSIAQKDIQKLQAQIEDQRRKSMVDQAKIKKLEAILAGKMKEANQTHNKYLDLVRKSDLGDEQIKALKDELDNERRKSNADQSRIQKIEQLLVQREKQMKDQLNKRGDYQRQIGFLKSEIDEERRKSMADQEKIRKLQEIKKEKQGLLADYNKKYQDQMRITDVNAQELKFLKAELDKERRKSDVDQNTIRNLKKVIDQKEKIAADHKNKHLNQIKFIQNQIDAERKKSMADQAKIRKLEELLGEKLKQDESQRRALAELMRKSDLNENELRLIKQALDEQRRKSLADGGLIKKLEGVIKDQMGQMKDKENHFVKNSKDIQALKEALEQERRKSFADQTKIQTLQKVLKQKTDQANGQYQKYLETVRKSELNEEELQFLKDQMQKQRRQSALDIDGYGRKVKDLQDIKRNLSQKLDQDRRRLAETGNYIKGLEEKSGSIQKLYKDANRKNESAMQELDKYKEEIEVQRRRSTAMEGRFIPKIEALIDENKRLIMEIKDLKGIVHEDERKIRDLIDQLEAAKKNISILENQLRDQSQTIAHLQRDLGSKDQQARRVIDEKVRQLRDLESLLSRNQAEKSRLQNQVQSRQHQNGSIKQTLHRAEAALRSKDHEIAEQINNTENLGVLLNDLKQKEIIMLQRNEQLVRQNAQNSLVYQSHLQASLGSPSKQMQRTTLHPITSNLNSYSSVGVDTLPERQHVIRVLKHQSKVYKLETAINRVSGDMSEASYSERY